MSNGIQQLNDSDDLLLRLRRKQRSKDAEDSGTKDGKRKPDIPLTPQRHDPKAESTLDLYDLPWKRAGELQ
ncbi:hypothetical protein [Streptomyces sp. NPDC001381]|uniref:hypothetical protein n=1 Tax=Streptomyces sp. NPDC001381 TaxID=3364567 RepID=UPI0036ADA8FA